MHMLMAEAEPPAVEASVEIKQKLSGLSITHLRNIKRVCEQKSTKKYFPCRSASGAKTIFMSISCLKIMSGYGGVPDSIILTLTILKTKLQN